MNQQPILPDHILTRYAGGPELVQSAIRGLEESQLDDGVAGALVVEPRGLLLLLAGFPPVTARPFTLP